MNLANEKPRWGAKKAFCSPKTTIRALKIQIMLENSRRMKSMTFKYSKTQLRYEITEKLEMNK